MRILQNKAQTISVTFFDDDTPVDAGAVTVTVRDSAGTTVSTGSAIAGSETGAYTYVLPAQSTLGPLTVTWAGTSTEKTNEEIVGGYLFSLQEARASDEIMQVGSRRNYSAADIKAVRDAVETEFERITGRSFTVRRKTETVEVINGVGYVSNLDVRNVLTVNGVAYTGTYNRVGRVEGLSGDSAEIVYEYGMETVPDDVKRAGLIRTRYNLAARNTDVPDRATSMTTEGNTTYTLATAGRGGSETGIPEVDATLGRYKVNRLSAVV